jgi:hypothetical protein
MTYASRISVLVTLEIYSDGRFWCGRGFDIFTQGRTLDELMENIREAVKLHDEEEPTVSGVSPDAKRSLSVRSIRASRC